MSKKMLSAFFLLGILGLSMPAQGMLHKLNQQQSEYLQVSLKKASKRKTLLFVYVWDLNAPASHVYLQDRDRVKLIQTMNKILEVETIDMSNAKQHEAALTIAQVASRDELPIIMILSPSGQVLFWWDKYKKYNPEKSFDIICRALIKRADSLIRKRDQKTQREGSLVYEKVCEIAEGQPLLNVALERLFYMREFGIVPSRSLGRYTKKALDIIKEKKDLENDLRVRAWWTRAEDMEKSGKRDMAYKLYKNIIRIAPTHELADKARKILNKAKVKFSDPLETIRKQLEAEAAREDKEEETENEDTGGETVAEVSTENGSEESTADTAGDQGGENGGEPLMDDQKPVENTVEITERKAQAMYNTTFRLLKLSKPLGEARLKKLIADFPDTTAAKKAGELLKN